MRSSLLKLPSIILLGIVIGCAGAAGCTRDKGGTKGADSAAAIDTAALLSDEIAATSRLATGEYHVRKIIVYDDRIWFRMWDPVGGYEIGGTNMQKGDKKYFDIWQEEPSNTHNSYSDPGCIFDGVYMFCAAHGFDGAREDHYGGEMWCLDGEKVWLQYDFVPGTGCDWIKEQTVAGGSLYWYNESNSQPDVFGSGIYRLDSKDGIPVVCTHIVPTGDFANTLRNLDGDLIFNLNSNHRVYVYKYTKEGWDGKSDKGYLET